MSTRKPEDILKSLDDTAADDALDHVLAMSDEERQAKLAAAGYAPGEIHAKADALFERIQRGAPPPPDAPPPALPPPAAPAAPATPAASTPRAGGLRSGQWTLIVLAAATAITLGGGAAVMHWLGTPGMTPREAPSAPPVPMPLPSSSAPHPAGLDVAELRTKAVRACEGQRWAECLSGLDLARTYDPAGDHTPLVTLARQEAILGLGGHLEGGAGVENAKQGPKPAP